MSQQPTPQPPSETRSVLYRLLVLVGILIGFFIYAYGWTVTEIDLDRPQEAQRQENVTIAWRPNARKTSRLPCGSCSPHGYCSRAVRLLSWVPPS